MHECLRRYALTLQTDAGAIVLPLLTKAAESLACLWSLAESSQTVKIHERKNLNMDQEARQEIDGDSHLDIRKFQQRCKPHAVCTATRCA